MVRSFHFARNLLWFAAVAIALAKVGPSGACCTGPSAQVLASVTAQGRRIPHSNPPLLAQLKTASFALANAAADACASVTGELDRRMHTVQWS